MPLAAIPAVAWAGIAAGGGALASAAISSSAARSAGNTVSAATDAATAEQRRQFDIYTGLQRPAYDRGEQAAGVYASALGLPGGSMTTGRDWNGYLGQNADVRSAIEGGQFGGEGGMTGAAERHFNEHGRNEGRAGPATITPQQQIAQQVQNTPGYQSQLDAGIKSIDRAAPLVGGMMSGRRMKALNDYGQNTFGSYYQNWLGQVGGVAGQGQQAGNNLGQAGQNFANNAGGMMVQGANARAQGQQSSANAWSSGIGSAIGSGIGIYGGSQGWFRGGGSQGGG